jgi:hypothetical protein
MSNLKIFVDGTDSPGDWGIFQFPEDRRVPGFREIIRKMRGIPCPWAVRTGERSHQGAAGMNPSNLGTQIEPGLVFEQFPGEEDIWVFPNPVLCPGWLSTR